jgi:hypothetical protein
VEAHILHSLALALPLTGLSLVLHVLLMVVVVVVGSAAVHAVRELTVLLTMLLAVWRRQRVLCGVGKVLSAAL